MKWFSVWLAVFVAILSNSAFGQVDTFASRLQAVEVSAVVQENPPQITLVWPGRDDATGYKIIKRPYEGSWSEVANLGAGATSWSDGNVAVGQRYEYKITKSTAQPYAGWGYLMAGVKAAPLEDAGKIILLAQDNVASACAGEIEQLRRDLIGEGWQVISQTVSAGSSVPQVKAYIKSQYSADPSGVKAVLLLGHVPVPYSGNICPDGHTNHMGAWPADVYYAEMDGNWTDSSVNTTSAERNVNWNVPGDGKFDQSFLPSPVDVAVGRVDFYEMTCYANKTPSRSEIDLTRAYLNKNHAFRTGQVQLQRRGLISDNFGLRDTNGVSAVGWRNFSAFFGSQNVALMDLNTYFSRLKTESALWTWGAGGGSYYYASGVGTSDDFALNDVNVAFTLWLGSYFGDWNNESNWLKAALGSGKVLVSTYSGLPHQFFHGMAMGETIGKGFVLSENNSTNDVFYPDGQGLYQVHQALLGDPTLRMFPRAGAGSVSATGGSGKATISWSAPSASDYVGAYIYRASSANGPFVRVTAAAVGGTSFQDSVGAGTYAYLVRPVYLEQNASGTFYNLGAGAVAANVTVTDGTPPPPPGPISLAGRVARGSVVLTVTATAGKGVIVDSTPDFRSWTVESNTVVPSSGSLIVTLPMSGPTKLFRAAYSGNP